jgi:membrane protein YqaA with SNARE-associated domain
MNLPVTRAAAASRDLAWRSWALAFTGFVAASGAALWLARNTLRNPGLEVLILLLLYLSFACTFLPLPTAWIVLWAARETDVLWVALVATAGTCIANLHDYHIVSGLLRAGRLRRARESAWHARAVAWFRRAPFLALALASFVPLPVDAVRLLAISAGYPRPAYLLASYVGRFPRYLLFAVLGHELRPSNLTIFLIALALVLVGGAKAVFDRARAARARTRSADDAGA